MKCFLFLQIQKIDRLLWLISSKVREESLEERMQRELAKDLKYESLMQQFFHMGCGPKQQKHKYFLRKLLGLLMNPSNKTRFTAASSYKTHYGLKKQDGIWKFCKGDIHSPS
ncbi:hypothetical protein MLD38_029835 [Melastoma candidum]|uniref:Uncharacterized protein n=1 Tax=Melastoma candidum TaxID=119954 RepID=A0ACB9N5B9_9MYRT|nr:hypothetical protein MLD38_029835 [Melastoma candidum]